MSICSQVVDFIGVFVFICLLLCFVVCFGELNRSVMMFDLTINQPVMIPALETKGRVVGLYYGETGAQYQVRYFFNGSPQTVYFYRDEIEEIL